jgi:hypothetical protein
MVEIPKKSVKIYSHITSFIVGYQMMRIVEKLNEIGIDNIYATYCDAIYIKNNCKFNNFGTFSRKEGKWCGKQYSVSFRNLKINSDKFPVVSHPERRIFVSGAGGCGKSYHFCGMASSKTKMRNFIDAYMFCPSWKLASEMK